MFQRYELSRTLNCHTNDVRAVKFLSPDQVLTASRDGFVKLNGEPIHESNVFMNSLAVSKSKVFIGSHDSTIIEYDLETKQSAFYLGHEANVSCLATYNDLLASGSWDTTARVWLSATESFQFKGHTQYVWDVKFVNEQQLLTASADRTIKLWDIATQTCIKTYSGHQDVVRTLQIISETEFASAGNDGTIKIWNLGSESCLKSVAAHNSFIYSLALAHNNLVSSGEDRLVKIWDVSQMKCEQEIILPAISQWSLDGCENGDFAVGSSDNCARVFTQNEDRRASSEELEEFQQLISSTAMGEHEIDESQIKDASVLQQPGTQEGQVVIVREGRELAAHQYSNGQWAKMGTVVGQNQSSGSKKQVYNGQHYDFVFDVDIADGEPPLKLPFNNTDNVYVVAEKFLLDNNLPSSYQDQVVQFIIQNSGVKQFDQSTSAAASTPAPASAPAPNTQASPISNPPVVFQYSKLLTLKSFQAEPMLKALTPLSPDVAPLVHSLPSSANELLQIAFTLLSSTPPEKLLPVYDLLRVVIPECLSLPAQTVWVHLISAIDPQLPKHTLLAIRGVNNLICRSDFEYKATNKSMLDQTLQIISEAAPSLPNSKPLAIALSTLFLNLTVLNIPVELVNLFAAINRQVTTAADEEATYRLMLATGLARVRGIKLHCEWKFTEARNGKLLESIKQLN